MLNDAQFFCLFIIEVGDVVGVADSTIRQSYRLMYPHRAKLFPKDFKFVVSIDDLPKHWNIMHHIIYENTGIKMELQDFSTITKNYYVQSILITSS